jgi:hypothetical protein
MKVCQDTIRTDKGTNNMDSRNFVIGLLSTTAAILLVGVVVVMTRPTPALAAGMTTSGGDYILTVGTGTPLDEEFVYVVDTAAHKMLAYRFDANRGSIEIIQGVDLSELRQGAGNAPGGQNPPPGRSRQP